MGYAKNKMVEDYIKEMDKLGITEFEQEKYLVRSGMEVYGGSFIKALSFALSKADSINSRKIKNAFPEYWKKYLNVGKKFIESEQVD